MAAPTIRGTLTRKTEPHQKCSSRKPEATGSMAAPPLEMPAHTAMALARSCAGQTLVRIDSVGGITNAAPRLMTPRAAMTIVEVSATVAISVSLRSEEKTSELQ